VTVWAAAFDGKHALEKGWRFGQFPVISVLAGQ
jgi:hypothetical protein